jgi:hypothetical protein
MGMEVKKANEKKVTCHAYKILSLNITLFQRYKKNKSGNVWTVVLETTYGFSRLFCYPN